MMSMQVKVKDEADTTFISEVFSGCVCYQLGLIKVGRYSTCMFFRLILHVRLLSCPYSAVCGLMIAPVWV